MNKFKSGEKVKVIASTYHRSALKHKAELLIGSILEIYHKVGDSVYAVYNSDKSDYWYFNESDLEKVEENKMRTLREMKVGDVVTDKEGEGSAKVQIVTPDGWMECLPDSMHFTSYTFSYGEEHGWKIKQEEPPKKMTKAVIEEALGYPVEIVEE